MSRINWNKYGLLLVFFIVFSPGRLFSQDVEIKNVTVLENGHVQIQWEFYGFTENIDPGLYRDALIGSCYSYSEKPIYKIPDTNRTTYIDTTVSLNRVRSYQISKTDIDLTSNKFNTIQTFFNHSV